MKWQILEHISDSKFQRLTGVKRSSFKEMLTVIDTAKPAGKKGRPSKLSNADKLLMMLMYYREYRSFCHISVTYGISEPQTGRIIRSMEDLLIKSKRFHLLGKKKLQEEGNNFEVIVVDVTESPIERPKKNKRNIIQEKRKGILSRAK